MIIDVKVAEEVTLVDELVFLEKSWYLEMFTKKGMVNKKETGIYSIHTSKE